MGYNQNSERTYSGVTAEDLSNHQFLFVRKGTDGKIYSCDNTHYALGILIDEPSKDAAGQYSASIATDGITRLAVGQAYPIGTFLVPYSDGTYKGYGYSIADATGTDEQYVRAMSLDPSTKPYDIIAVKLIDPRPDVTSKGATGVAGPTGATGIQGLQGVTGLSLGSTGVQGIQGATGIQGLQGITGLGDTGVQGIQGTTGVQGVQGDTGVQGSTGIQGATGVA